MAGASTGKSDNALSAALEKFIFGHRALIVVVFALITCS